MVDYTKEELESILAFGVECAKEAGTLIRDTFNERKKLGVKGNIEYKCSVDLVTETDKACEALVFKRLQEKYPDHLFVGEESVAAGTVKETLGDGPTWLVDPVDGTTNFVHGFPFTCISIAFVNKKQVMAGVVYGPILDEMFTAVRGGGAFVNGEAIHTSDTSSLGQALIATGFPTDRCDENLDYILANLRGFLSGGVRGIRRIGSAALDMCSVACGRMDAYFELHVHGWDVAAGSLIVEEAGGVVRDPRGGPANIMTGKIVAACNEALADEFCKQFKPFPAHLFPDPCC
eukprot:TRINITY_DN6888_c0_g1_i1.p1 TRINITY_DN6888_c0_g1~~TRINITY_DN6888_c0_g1_i1.p1  ORF type:complete len:319 (+),score=62.23 TRINITY_DN6888_c0_g1_i1:88-957(+)